MSSARERAEKLYAEFEDRAFEDHAFEKDWWIGIAATAIEEAVKAERERCAKVCERRAERLERGSVTLDRAGQEIKAWRILEAAHLAAALRGEEGESRE